MGTSYSIDVEMVTVTMPISFLFLSLFYLSWNVSATPAPSVYQIFSKIDQTNPQGPHFMPQTLYGQLLTSRFFPTTNQTLQIFQPAELRNTKQENVLQTN